MSTPTSSHMPVVPAQYVQLATLIKSLQQEIERLDSEGHEIVKHLHEAIDKQKLQQIVANIHNFNN